MEASGSLEDLLGQVDSTLEAPAPASAPTAPTSISALDEDLNALLAAAGLDGGGSTDKRADDDAFDDIFGGSVGGGSQGAGPPQQGGGAAAGGGSEAAVEASTGGDGSGSTAWKNFDAAERADFLKWLEEDDVAQGLDTVLLVGGESRTGSNPTFSLTSTPASASAAATIPTPPRAALTAPKPPLPTPTPTPAGSTPPAAKAASNNNLSSLDSIVLAVGSGERSSALDTSVGTPEAILQRISSMLAAPPPPQPEAPQANAAQRFFAEGTAAGSGLGEENAESRAARMLQAYCQEYKGVPDGLRGPIWRRLLPNHEPLARAFGDWLRASTSTGEGWRLETVHRRLGVPNKDLIRRDAAAVARAFLRQDQEAPAGANAEEERGKAVEAFAEAVENGITFYCTQLRLDYEPAMGPIYGALVASLGEECASEEVLGRFHTFCHWLAPYLMLVADPAPGDGGSAREGFVKEAHAEFLLLLTYHAPLLVQHLDRACPGWELPPHSPDLVEGGLAKAEQVRADAEAEEILGALEGKWSSSSNSTKPQPPSFSSSTTTAPSPSSHPAESSSLAVERERSAGGGHLDGSGKGSKGKDKDKGVGGLLPTSWLLGLFAGAALIPSTDALLRLWDGCLLRGDRFLGLYLAAALLLRRKTELLALQGPALRARLEGIIVGAAGVLPPIGEWLEEADRLARLTPLSLRVHLTALERAASDQHLSRLGKEGTPPTTQQPPLLTPSPPQGPPPSCSSVPPTMSPSRVGPVTCRPVQEMEGYAARLAALTWSRQRAVDEMVQQQQQQAQYQLSSTTSGRGSAGGAGGQRWGLASPTRRRRALEQAASDPDVLALLATKLCMTVAPEEAVPQLCLPSSGYQQYGGVRFFGLDCRPKEQLGAGRYPTAYHLDPARLEDPEEITRLLRTLEPLKGSKHVLLIGSGDRSNLVAAPPPSTALSPLGGHEKTAAARMREQLQRAAREDVTHLNTAALFLLKRGFPYVSILDGGFVATHAYLLQRTRERNSGLPTTAPPGLGLSALIDHVPNHCRMCKHEALLRFQRDQALGESSGSGGTSGLAAAQKALHRAGSSLSMAANEASPSLAALSQLGQSSLESLRSKATGLFGKLGSGGASMGGDASHSPTGAIISATSASASSPGTPGVPLDAAVQEVGSFLKGTVLSVAKRAEQAMVEARGAVNKAPSPTGSVGGGGGGAKQQQPSPSGAVSASAAVVASPSVFVIEDDEAEEEEDEHKGDRGEEEGGSVSSCGRGKPALQAAPSPSPQPAKRTSDIDRELALKLHALNGLQKGQEVEVSPEALPGAQLFSVYKQKEGQGQGTAQEVPRYIALTAERMLVLEAAGGVTAQRGVVKSNHHLTELGRMTFNKKQPDVVNLYFRVGGAGMPDSGGPDQQPRVMQKEEMKRRSYRIGNKEEFIACLQERLRRFK